MFARILKSGTFHDVVGYVVRQFHDPKEYTPDTWRVIDSDCILTVDWLRMVQSFEVGHGFMPGKENPAGHIAISFDKADAPRLTDEFMAQLAKEYMEGMGIKNTQYLVVRHFETEHPHFHIVYNRVNMEGKVINERNNFKRSDKVVKHIKDKYGLTYSPLKQKYEERKPEFERKIRAALYRCTSWEMFIERLANGGIDVKFHLDRETGERIGVKFSDDEITLNGGKVHHNFTYRKLDNVFKLNARQGHSQAATVQTPKVTVTFTKPESPTILESVADSLANLSGGLDLFQVGPGYDAEQEAMNRAMDAEERKRKRKAKKKGRSL